MPDDAAELQLLRSQLAAMEQLLEVHESAVLQQAERLEDALAEVRQRAEEAERARAGAERARHAAERSAARLRFLSDAGVTLASSLDYQTTLRSVAALAVPAMADWCVVDLLDENGELRRLAVAHEDTSMVRLVHQLRERYPDDPDARHGVHHVLRTGEPELVPEVPIELLREVARDAEHLRIIESLELRSYIIVPLQLREQTVGALTLVGTRQRAPYDESDLRMACELATRAAIAIDNARLVQKLEATQQHLEQTAAEVEAQAEELEATVQELEATTQELLESNEEIQSAHAEADLARIAAEEANAAKSQFLATMSHELRTPLNAIDGYAELMQLGIHGPLSDAQLQALLRIRRAQKRLLSLINDVLNFAKLEAGQVTFESRPVTVDSLIAAVEAILAPQVAAKQLALDIGRIETGLAVHADPEKVEQVLLNLIANAVKFTEPGGRIGVSAEKRDGVVLLHVDDTGIGIPADRLESIFEPFVQAGNAMVREHGGVGLGLAISRDLARRMDGDLHCAASRVGAGSRFTLSLPLAARPAVYDDCAAPAVQRSL